MNKPSEKAMRNFYKAVEPALLRIAKKVKQKESKHDKPQ